MTHALNINRIRFASEAEYNEALRGFTPTHFEISFWRGDPTKNQQTWMYTLRMGNFIYVAVLGANTVADCAKFAAQMVEAVSAALAAGSCAAEAGL